MGNKEIFKTYKNVFDEKTVKSIWWLITHRKFEGLESPIKIGKESNVFTAITKGNERVAVKIFRINSSNFFKMSRYLAADPRFKNVRNTRSVIMNWAKREFLNLKKAYEAGVKVPTPIAIKDNVIVMNFIGAQPPEPPKAAPLLKDYCENPEEIYSNIIKNIRLLYKAKLVHGDLNEFNMLNENDDPTIIDLSHATPISSYASKEILERDVENICRFFNKKGLKLNKEEVLKSITSD